MQLMSFVKPNIWNENDCKIALLIIISDFVCSFFLLCSAISFCDNNNNKARCRLRAYTHTFRIDFQFYFLFLFPFHFLSLLFFYKSIHAVVVFIDFWSEENHLRSFHFVCILFVRCVCDSFWSVTRPTALRRRRRHWCRRRKSFLNFFFFSPGSHTNWNLMVATTIKTKERKMKIKIVRCNCTFFFFNFLILTFSPISFGRSFLSPFFLSLSFVYRRVNCIFS